MGWVLVCAMLATNRVLPCWSLIHCITWFWAWLWKFYSASGAERDFPIGSILALYRLYERELRLESSFKIWWDVWLIFDGPERVVFLQGLSLVDPEFTWDMLGAWYCMVACCTSSLEEMD